MHDPSADKPGRIREPKKAWLDRLEEPVAQIARSWYELAQVDWDPDRLNRLHRQIKDLAADSGRFGLARLSEAFSSLDTCLASYLGSDLRPGPQQIDEVFQRIRALKSIAHITVRIETKTTADEEARETSGKAAEPLERAQNLQDDPGDPKVHRGQTKLMEQENFLRHLEDLVATDDAIFGALMVVELDGVEQIRSERGETTNDSLRNEATALLTTQMQPGDAASRLGAGTWAILARRSTGEELSALAEQLRQAVEAHLFRSREERLMTTASIGLCGFQGDPGDASQLIARAGAACARALSAGGNRVAVHAGNEPEYRSDEEHDRIARLLQETLGRDGLHILCKPRINLRDGERELYELAPLLPTPEGGHLLLSDFLRQTGDENLLGQVDNWIMDQAFALMERNHREGGAVNLVVRQDAKALREPARLERLREQLQARHLVGTGLKLEFSFADLVADPDITTAYFEAVAPMGIGLSLTDFNANAASFEALKSLPVEYVELDARLIAGSHGGMASLADRIHALGIKAVACCDDGREDIAVTDVSGIDFHAQREKP